MSKVFNLKEWVTVAEAAKHLSGIFSEDVSEADVLRLALDGKLRVSVHFVNYTYARCGKVVGSEEAKRVEFPKTFRLQLRGTFDNEKEPEKVRIIVSPNIGDDRYVNLSDEITTIGGVWDLPMIGGEKLDIEHEYQNLTGGPSVTLQYLDGAFVEGREGELCQLQARFSANEYLKSSPYYPAGGLPHDSVLVVRTDALREFILRASESDKQTNRADILTLGLDTIRADKLRFPNEPDVDWGHALRLDMWKLQEGIFYLLGINPDGELASAIEANIGITMFDDRYASQKDMLSIKIFSRYRDSAIKSIAAGVLSETIHCDCAFFDPKALVQWALEKGLSVVDEVKSLIGSTQLHKPKSVDEPEELHPKEHKSWAQIVKVLCAAQGLDLSKPYPAADALQALCDTHGVKLSTGNIVDKLKQARDIE